jgi:hypothetical protein
MKQQAAEKKTQARTRTQVSPELASIVRSISKGAAGLPLAKHIHLINDRKTQEAECFLRACAVRLRLEGGA